MKEIPDNVKKFIARCDKIVAQSLQDSFQRENHWKIEQCESPIEQLFLYAISTLIECNRQAEEELDIMQDVTCRRGVTITQQKQIGDYRVDFALEYNGAYLVYYGNGKILPNREIKKVVVELDGHQFHDKDEPQRRYEKKRDRFMQKNGYKVFHYTGSEICRDPFSAAKECLAYLTGEPEEFLTLPLEMFMEEA